MDGMGRTVAHDAVDVHRKMKVCICGLPSARLWAAPARLHARH